MESAPQSVFKSFDQTPVYVYIGKQTYQKKDQERDPRNAHRIIKEIGDRVGTICQQYPAAISLLRNGFAYIVYM